MPTYDYAQAGAYFVTLCTQGRACLLHDPPIADIILDVWDALPARFPTIVLDEFVIMPNHVHLVVWLQAQIDGQGQTGRGQIGQGQIGQGQALPLHDWMVPAATKVNPKPRLGDVIGAFKSLVFAVYLDWIKAHDVNRQASFWQRNYYEHVVRNERELGAIRQYIVDNPARWDMDRDNLDGKSGLPVPDHIKHYLADLKYPTE
ncbi:MAG: hypothetical protein M1434_06775 [Chloroflexi bacterium]|nr:hypothetical protein [Chloroflexota bacterium]